MTPSLSPQELRENLVRLVELEALRAEVKVYRDYIERESELAKKEQANFDEALRLAKESLNLQQRQTELEKQRADFYENAFKSVTKGRSKKCWFFKIFTAGLAKCT